MFFNTGIFWEAALCFTNTFKTVWAAFDTLDSGALHPQLYACIESASVSLHASMQHTDR
jgi:hypothetical protein